PLYSKISVLGDDQHPLYAELTAAQPQAIGEGPFRERLKGFGIQPADPKDVLWNFEKFLVNRHGEVVARFSPDVTADDPRLLQAMQAELARRSTGDKRPPPADADGGFLRPARVEKSSAYRQLPAEHTEHHQQDQVAHQKQPQPCRHMV